jgi:hypothetical protein
MLKKTIGLSKDPGGRKENGVELPTRFGRGTPADMDDEIELYGEGFDEVGERVGSKEMLNYSLMKLLDQIKSVMPVCIFLGGFQAS